MIKFELADKPEDFNQIVKEEGLNFLQEKGYVDSRGVCLNQNLKDEDKAKLPESWQGYSEFFKRYNNFCLYLGAKFHLTKGSLTVDHFLPKSKYVCQAYDWENFRPCYNRINSAKNDYEDVLDPFKVENDWFSIDFSDFSVLPNKELTDGDLIRKINATIKRLKLNDSEYKSMRQAYYDEYFNPPEDRASRLSTLKKYALFVYLVAEREGKL